MSRMVFCAKLGKEETGLTEPPFPGALGNKIFANISQQAWNKWINHQTMLINEYRLSLVEPAARQFLREEMDKFLFGQGSEAPPGFTAVE